ncbi:hypothetical protein HOLleu_05267 [Holothuria leucospilota]|uniref:Integrase zinc-binding domain-containing protein n=1 Tax=Holothuria leucospilota TaxID=206669 RepID=A0A9Q1CJE3_HOLLE|nr:hypothetical protein HOLleu_05267 [Holothuria leucospilota]
MVRCLIDTGAQVSTLTESFNEHLAQEGAVEDVSSLLWLSGGNGLDIPFIGYVELTVRLGGREFPHMGFLVVKDPVGTPLEPREKHVPGVLGCNILRHVVGPFHSMDVHGEETNTRVSTEGLEKIAALMREVNVGGKLEESPCLGVVRSLGPKPVLIPARSSVTILGSTRQANKGATFHAIYEADSNYYDHLPSGLVLYPGFVEVDKSGVIPIQVCNLSEVDVHILPRNPVGTLSPGTAEPRIEIVEAGQNEVRFEVVCTVDPTADLFERMQVGELSQSEKQKSSAKLGAVEARWAAELAQFNFKIKYKPGRRHGNADALSRKEEHGREPQSVRFEEILPQVAISQPPTTPLPSEIGTLFYETNDRVYLEEVRSKSQCLEPKSVSTLPTMDKADLSRLQKLDPHLSRLWHFWGLGKEPTVQELKQELKPVTKILRDFKRIKEIEGVLYRTITLQGQEVKQLCLPRSLKDTLLEALHDSAGHQSTQKTIDLARLRCYWPTMHTDITDYCSKCQRCMLAKAVDHLLGLEPDNPCVEDHHARLTEAFRNAASKTETEVLRRKQRLDRNAGCTDLTIGTRVFLRNRTPRGRNKMQDFWADKPYKVVSRPYPDSHVYVLEPLDGNGPVQVLNRRDILDSKELVTDMLHPTEEHGSEEDSVGTNDDCNTSTQEERDFEIGLCYEPRSGKGDKTSTVTTTCDTPDTDTPLESEDSLREEDPDPTLPEPDCDPTVEIQNDDGGRGYDKAGEHTESLPTMSDNDSGDPGHDPPQTLRRSTRSTAGYNPNPHNEPRS